MSIEKQAIEVDRVKRSESGMILDPVTITSNKTIHDALDIMARFRISGVPVVDNGKLKGILTNRDIRFETNLELLVSDRMTSKNLVTVKQGTTLAEAKEHRIEKLLVVDSKGSLCGLITVKDILKKENYPLAAVDKHGRLLVAAAVGVGENTLDRVSALVDSNVDAIIVDTAHGHSEGVLKTLAAIKKQFSIDVIAGNIATENAAKALIDVGVPQLTAVMDVYNVAAKLNIPVISDGGMRYSGDVAKSLAAGADTAMLGSIFAGTDESPGEVILWEGRSFKSYRGMGSIAAMKDGSKDRYFQNETTDSRKLVPEGIEGMVPHKGPIRDTIHQLTGGIRSSMGYCGAKDLTTLKDVANFVKITGAGVKESHPHDINITKESPNYRKPN